MDMKKLLVLLCLPIVIKVGNSEWVLGIHVQHFQNLYNAEFRMGFLYCCCDLSTTVVSCQTSLTKLNVAACTPECEPYFEMHLEVCFANGTCSYMANEFACINNDLATCISPLLVQLHSNESMIDNITNTTLYVDVLESPVDYPASDQSNRVNVIDNFTIAIPETVSNCVDESNSLTVQGKHGIGNLTLAYFNLTTDPITSCSSADVSTFSTSSPVPTYNSACECSSFPTSTPDAEAATDTVWISLTVLFLLFTVTFAAISAILGFVVYRTREDVNSWLSSKLTKQREHRSTGRSTNDANDDQGEDECEHVYSTVHKKKKEVVDEPSYMNTDTMQPEPYFYDETTHDY